VAEQAGKRFQIERFIVAPSLKEGYEKKIADYPDYSNNFNLCQRRIRNT
jgi:hypothetical protein